MAGPQVALDKEKWASIELLVANSTLDEQIAQNYNPKQAVLVKHLLPIKFQIAVDMRPRQ